MTTPSETRAGKLPDLPRAAYQMPSGDEGGAYFYTADQMHAYALQALAASEPVSHWPCEIKAQRQVDDTVIIGATLVLDGEFFRELIVEDVMFLTPIDQQERARHLLSTKNTHPAPEQPGKGEAEVDYPMPDVQTFLELPLADRLRIDATALRGNGYAMIPKDLMEAADALTTPQPSDPAEGDALSALIADWRERAKNGPGALNVAAKELEAALSTPPTAAVRVDMDDLLFVGFDKNSEHRLFRMRETAERHCIGEIKTYAALDPQVKR